MPQNHYLPTQRLSYGTDTYSYWTKQPSGHVVVFVHGFAGKAMSTWDDFAFLLPLEAKCTSRDLIFFGYDGKHVRSINSAMVLRDFIHNLVMDPLSIINPSLPPQDARPGPFRVTRITLVAHSLGAIVSREALLDGYKRNNAWAGDTELVLFAPAHSGAHVLPLVRQALSSLGYMVSVAQNLAHVLGYYQVLLDLEPGSQTLTNLQRETVHLLSNGNGPTLIAKKVILGEHDTIVEPHPFAYDPPAVLFQGRNHMNVCKPDTTFHLPIREVLDVI